MRTLIVDDSNTNAELLKGLLTPFGDCDIAYSGEDAVGLFGKALKETHPYKLVCLDMLMPEIDGQAALQAIRRLESENGFIVELNGAKVIMALAADSEENIGKVFDGQCDAFMTKPVTREELLRHVYSLRLVDPDAIVRVLLDIHF